MLIFVNSVFAQAEWDELGSAPHETNHGEQTVAAPAAPVVPIHPTAPAATAELPRIAVYVTGNVGEDEKSALGTRMLVALINSGRYRGIERSSAFVAELEREHETQRSGAVDDAQISALGRRFGVKYVCIAAITPAFGSFQVSARIVDVESAEVVSIGEAFSPLRSANDLARVSGEVVREVLGGSSAPSVARSEPRPRQEPRVRPKRPRPETSNETKTFPLTLTLRISAGALAAGGIIGGIAYDGMVKSEYDKWLPAETWEEAQSVRRKTESHITTRNMFYVLAAAGLSGLTLTFFF